jgi:hypothetical protein
MNFLLKKVVIFFYLLFLLGGCFPMPHSRILAPSISGVVRDGNNPLSATPVYLDASFNSKGCSDYDLVSKTDDDGVFAIGPVTEFVWVVPLIGDPIAHWELCVDTAEGRKAVLHQGGIGMPPGALDIECDISSSDTLYIEAFGSIEGHCIERKKVRE